MTRDTTTTGSGRGMMPATETGRRMAHTLVRVSLWALVLVSVMGLFTGVAGAHESTPTESQAANDPTPLGQVGETLEEAWCWAVGCPEPVETEQSAVVVVDETTVETQEGTVENVSGPGAEPNQTVPVDETTVETQEGSVENGSGPGAEPNQTVPDDETVVVDAEPDPADNETVVVDAEPPQTDLRSGGAAGLSVVAIGHQLTHLWWLLVGAGLVLLTWLVGRTLRGRDDRDETDSVAGHPAGGRPTGGQMGPSSASTLTDGGQVAEDQPSGETEQRSAPRLKAARERLDATEHDRSVGLAIRALAEGGASEDQPVDYDRLFEHWRPTAEELSGSPRSLEELREIHQRAVFSPHATGSEDARATIRTVEALLGQQAP